MYTSNSSSCLINDIRAASGMHAIDRLNLRYSYNYARLFILGSGSSTDVAVLKEQFLLLTLCFTIQEFYKIIENCHNFIILFHNFILIEQIKYLLM